LICDNFGSWPDCAFTWALAIDEHLRRRSEIKQEPFELPGPTHYWLLLAESHLTRCSFGSMLGRIEGLPLPLRQTRQPGETNLDGGELTGEVFVKSLWDGAEWWPLGLADGQPGTTRGLDSKR
jgi:hypothetical protein